MTETLDGQYVCVECGTAGIQENAHASSDSNPGIAYDRAAAASGVLVPPDSGESPDISLVLPTKNEEDGVCDCIDRAKAAFEELGVTGEIIVSDSSDDGTAELARERGALVVDPPRPGYGNAYRYAFEYVRGDVVAMADADTTYDLRELPRLVDVIQNGDVDMVVGNRFQGEIKPGAMPALHQYVGNPVLSKILNGVYGVGVSDAHSGFRVFTQEALESLSLQSSGFEFAKEMLMQAQANGITVEEVPITYHEREGDATLNSFRDGWRHIRFMLVNAPGYLFTLPAVAFGVVGVLAMVLSVVGAQVTGVTFGVHTVVAGGLLAILGAQLGAFSVGSAVGADPIQPVDDSVSVWIRDNLRLEHGATAGLLLAGAGAAYVAAMIGRWVASGYQALPFVVWNMVAFTAIVIGVEMIFFSFFLSMLRQNQED